jgi:hypothetical protein
MERPPLTPQLWDGRWEVRADAGLWVSVVPFEGELYVMLFRNSDDGSSLALEDHTPAVRAALLAVADEYAHWPPPRRYRVTAEHLERYPALTRAVFAGKWTRTAWSPGSGEPADDVVLLPPEEAALLRRLLMARHMIGESEDLGKAGGQ